MTGELVVADVAFLTRWENFSENFSAALGFLLGDSILWPSISRMRVTSHVLWQHLHASYPSQAHESVDSSLAAAREVLGMVDELLMNPVNFHVDDPSLLINGRSDWIQEGLTYDDGGLLMRIHIHDHEINQGWRILELNEHILCYPIGLHYSGVCQSQLMRVHSLPIEWLC
jgi:hypothetical protein